MLETDPKRLLRGTEPLPLSPRHLDLLHCFLAHAGKVLTKESLVQAVWGSVAASDNSLARLVSDLRRVLSTGDDEEYIRNVPRMGYRFVAPADAVDLPAPAIDLFALLAPDRAWGESLTALESLERQQLVAARQTLDRLVATHPREPRFHTGLALTCALLYDSTRANPQQDTATLQRAFVAAQEACRLQPDAAEPWATFGLILERTGDRENALAALRRATRFDLHNWLHHFRLGTVSWGRERLTAVRDTLTHNPGFAMAYFLAATVWVSLDALDDAEREVDAGIAAMESESSSDRFAPVALYYLKGLLLNARGATTEAIVAFDREIAREPRGHLYARECAANAWYARGVCSLTLGQHDDVRRAFGESLTRVPGHPMAQAGLDILDGDHGPREPAPSGPLAFEREMARAARLAHAGDRTAAVDIILSALQTAPPGNAGWLVPIEPLLRVWDHRELWTSVLAALRARAR